METRNDNDADNEIQSEGLQGDTGRTSRYYACKI